MKCFRILIMVLFLSTGVFLSCSSPVAPLEPLVSFFPYSPKVQPTVNVSFPQWDSNFTQTVYPKLSGWQIEVHGENYDDSFYTEEGFSVQCEINQPYSILAYPICKDSSGNLVDFFKPAGAVFFGSSNLTEINLDWEAGFAAKVMSLLLKNANNQQDFTVVKRFNWQRMEEIIRENCRESVIQEEKSFFNPWNLNLNEVTKSIASTTFRSTLLTQKNVFDYELSEPDKIVSSYVPENKNIGKFQRICLKESEVNLISDYNLRGIIVERKAANRIFAYYCALPILVTGYD